MLSYHDMNSLLTRQDSAWLQYLATLAPKHCFDKEPAHPTEIVGAAFLDDATPLGVGCDHKRFSQLLKDMFETQDTFTTPDFTIEKHSPFEGTMAEVMPGPRYTFTLHTQECIHG